MNYEMLVNKDNKIVKDNVFELVKIKTNYKPNDDNIYLEKETYKKFLEMKNDAKKYNYEIEIESAYRTHEYQKKLFDEFVLERGLEYASKYVAKPYTSEHETGLAIDFCIYKNNEYITEHEMKDLEETKWVHDNCYKYGFILRYPKGKENITKYNYEPWHIRYVGGLAKYIFDNKLTLEEYYKLH